MAITEKPAKIRPDKIFGLGIVLGYRCNFSCAHCATAEKKSLSLTNKEIIAILRAIKTHSIKSLLFVGGEPTLYVPVINGILSSLERLDKTEVGITTNGHFAGSRGSAKALLSTFRKLDYVQLSYDKFHLKFLPGPNVKNLYLACKELGIRFNVLFAMESPLDLALLKDLKAVGDFPISIQPVLPLGAARTNSIKYKGVLSTRKMLASRCPSRAFMSYLCGQGFTSCCSSLTFSGSFSGYVHRSPMAHRDSHFYRLISKLTLGEIRKKLGLEREPLPEMQASPCPLCERLFAAKSRGSSK
ncbi:MAG: radical SAM protein [Elusimicrobiales bacterium]|nr:radical SAM protein [Elusimicrobiales bacterium]